MPSARTGSNHPQSTSGPSKLSKKGRSAIPSASTKPGASPYTASGPGRRPSFFNRGSRSTAPDASTDPRAKKSNHLPPLFADNAPTPPNTSSQERRGGRLASISSSQSMSSLVGTPQSPPRASGQDTQPHPSTHQRSRSDLAERESDKIFVSQVDPIPNYHISLPHDSVYDQAGMSWHSWLDETTRNPRPLPAGYFSAGLSSLPRYRTVGSPLPVYELAAEFTPPSWPEPTAELTPPSWPEPTTGLTPPSWPEPPPPCSWHETLLRPRSEPPLPTGLICELSAEPPSRSRHRRVVVSIDFVCGTSAFTRAGLTTLG
jgi:hypothetical protein